MRVTRKGSAREYERLLNTQKPTQQVPAKPKKFSRYDRAGKSVVAIVRSNDRKAGLEEALQLMGGIQPLCEDVKGEILIKPNCNADAPFPLSTHLDTIRFLIDDLTDTGFPANRIVVGDMSGKGRGLPTKFTMQNLGYHQLARKMGIQVIHFDEEEWISIKHPKAHSWPDGIRIPRRVYEAERIILAPIMRPHMRATYTASLKLSVGFIDVPSREWLHNGKDIHKKIAELNLFLSPDLVVLDAMQFFSDQAPIQKKHAKPGIILAGSNRVAVDAFALGIMREYNAQGVAGRPAIKQEQLSHAMNLGVGSTAQQKIIIKTSNMTNDNHFYTLMANLNSELT